MNYKIEQGSEDILNAVSEVKDKAVIEMVAGSYYGGSDCEF